MSDKKEEDKIENYDKNLIKILELAGWAYEYGFEEGRSKTTLAFKDFIIEKGEDIKPDTEKMMEQFLKFTKQRQNEKDE